MARGYYVTIKRGPRTGYAFGTSSIERPGDGRPLPPGTLNAHVGKE